MATRFGVWRERRRVKKFQRSASRLRGERTEAKRLGTQLKEARLRQELRGKRARLRRLEHPHLYSAAGRLGSNMQSGSKKLARGLMGYSTKKRKKVGWSF